MIIQSLIFVLSTMGCWVIISKIIRVHAAFLPSLAIAIQTCILFIAGLLNCLSETSYGIVAIGIIGGGYCIVKDRKIISRFWSLEYAFLVLLMLILVFRLNGESFTHYDNFSHWAIVVKGMLATNRLPNFQDRYIMFQSYPLGSSMYIYSAARIIGTQEFVQMTAQSYMVVAFIMPLFAFVKEAKIVSFITITGFTVFSLCYNIMPTELLVDTLLPIVAMSCIVYIYYMVCHKMDNLQLCMCLFYLVLIIQIKNSGIYFVVMILLYLLSKGRKKVISICAIPSIVSLFLWQKHWQYVFSEAANSRHAISLSWFRQAFGEKSRDGIINAITGMVKFSLTWTDAVITLLVFVLVGIAIFLVNREKMRSYITVFKLCSLLYFTYLIGLCGVFLFSMPGDFATEVNYNSESGLRYSKTIVLSVLYLLMIPLLELLNGRNSVRVRVLTSVTFVFSLLCLLTVSNGSIGVIWNWNYYNKEKWKEERKVIDYLGNECRVPENKTYCVITPDDDAGFAYFYARYRYLSDRVSWYLTEFPGNEIMDDEYVFLLKDKQVLTGARKDSH